MGNGQPEAAKAGAVPEAAEPRARRLEPGQEARIPGLEVGAMHPMEVGSETVPVILVPDFLGTKLIVKESGEKAWDPDDTGWTFWEYGMVIRGPKDKKDRLIGPRFDKDRLVPLTHPVHRRDFAAVDRALPTHGDGQEKRGKRWPRAADRGWDAVSWKRYGALLERLQSRATWDGLGQELPRFEVPVYAFAYNWTASHEAAGKKLAEFISKVVEAHAKSDGRCEKVILVTHGSGGLVARSAAADSDASVSTVMSQHVLGVIHGAQPALGAPAWYWRFKAGFERPKGWSEAPGKVLWCASTAATAEGFATQGSKIASLGTVSRGSQGLSQALAAFEVNEEIQDVADLFPVGAAGAGAPAPEVWDAAPRESWMRRKARSARKRIANIPHGVAVLFKKLGRDVAGGWEHVKHPQRALREAWRSLRAYGSAWALGTNGAEVCAVFAWMPGALELLPSTRYRDGEGRAEWLRVVDEDGATVNVDGFGKLEFGGATIWDQVYRDDKAPWALVQKEYLVPGTQRNVSPGVVQAAAPEDNELSVAWTRFKSAVDAAKRFHDRVDDAWFEQTKSLYGTGKIHPTCDAVLFSAELASKIDKALRLAWDVTKVAASIVSATLSAIMTLGVVSVVKVIQVGASLAELRLSRWDYWTFRGGFHATIPTQFGGVSIELVHPADIAEDAGHGAGDGTVPEGSASAGGQAEGFEWASHDEFFAGAGKSGEAVLDATVRAVTDLLGKRRREVRGEARA